MTPAHRLLTRQFLEWVAERPRDHATIRATWPSSCPRLAIWEDALEDGLVAYAEGQLRLTPQGEARRTEA